MSADQDQDYLDNDFEEPRLEDSVLEDGYELDFDDSRSMKKHNRAKSRRDARRQLEDYFERKALKEQEDDWDYNLDY